MVNFKLTNTGRVIKEGKLIDIYLLETLPLTNFTSIDNTLGATATSGTFLTSTFLNSGIDILNKNTGAVLEYNTLTSGISIIGNIQFDTNLRRSISVSGSKFGGKI
jgi:hypothetical protein